MEYLISTIYSLLFLCNEIYTFSCLCQLYFSYLLYVFTPKEFSPPVGNWGKHSTFGDGPPWRAVWSCQMSGTGWHRRFFMNSSAIVFTQVSSSFSGVADVQRVLKTAKWSRKGLQFWLQGHCPFRHHISRLQKPSKAIVLLIFFTLLSHT